MNILAIIALATSPIALIAYGLLPHSLGPVPIILGPYEGCSSCSQSAKQIAWSLDHQPQDWKGDQYVIGRRTVYIWVANSSDGIAVGKNGNVRPAGMGFDWVPSGEDQYIIWNAYQRWRETRSLHASDIHP